MSGSDSHHRQKHTTSPWVAVRCQSSPPWGSPRPQQGRSHFRSDQRGETTRHRPCRVASRPPTGSTRLPPPLPLVDRCIPCAGQSSARQKHLLINLYFTLHSQRSLARSPPPVEQSPGQASLRHGEHSSPTVSRYHRHVLPPPAQEDQTSRT